MAIVKVKTEATEGFSKKQAAQALQMEAFKRYGTRAKGITNVHYKIIPDAYHLERCSEASGDVVTWEQATPTGTETTEALPAPPDEEEQTATAPSREFSEQSKEFYQAPLPPERTMRDKAMGEPLDAPSSPGSILILSNKDLIDYRFWVLGRVSVKSRSQDGFTQERANQALQLEAFKQYGSQAQGLVNISHKEKKKLPLLGKTIVEAAGDVVAWEKPKKAPRSVAVQPRASQTSRVPVQKKATTADTRSPHEILVVPSKDLYRLNFTVLGSITVKGASKKGFTEQGAIKALKIDAFKRYGPQTRGITNIEFKRQTTLLLEKKITEAYADAVTWEPGEEIYRAVRGSETYPSFYEGAEEGVTADYTTRTVRAGQIDILKGEDTEAGKYSILGPVTVEAPTRDGLKKSHVDRALRKQAFKQFGGNARYIVNVEYERAQCLKCEGKYVRASGEVVSW